MPTVCRKHVKLFRSQISHPHLFVMTNISLQSLPSLLGMHDESMRMAQMAMCDLGDLEYERCENIL